MLFLNITEFRRADVAKPLVEARGRIDLGPNEIPVVPDEPDYAEGLKIVPLPGAAPAMILRAITAVAHPEGNRIDCPGPTPTRSNTLSSGSSAARAATPAARTTAWSSSTSRTGSLSRHRAARRDRPLLRPVPATGTPPVDDVDPHNRASATALSPYGFAGMLYDLLPSIYRRYDAARLPAPGSVLPDDAGKGQLRRFLDLPGGELDRLYSLARTRSVQRTWTVSTPRCSRCSATGSAGAPTSGCRSRRSVPRSATRRTSTGPSGRSTR